MAIWVACRRDNLELPAIESLGWIGHFQAIAAAIRVVDGGINIGYRTTRWIMLSCGIFFSSGCVTECCYG